MKIRILNFGKYNPRGDVKNPSWIRLERNWWVDMWDWLADCQRIWFLLLGTARFEDGVCEISTGFVAANLRIEEKTVRSCIQFLLDKQRIELIESDSVTDTLRTRNADGTDTGVTGRDETGRDIPSSPKTESEPGGSRPSPRSLAELWNSNSHPEMPKLNMSLFAPTGKRWKASVLRLKEQPELAYWRSIIERIALSSFCRGVNERGWRADFDFLTRQDTHIKVGEGKYDDRQEASGIDWSKIGAEERP
jgi:hypothetical protein